jgi:hypothetical protein
MQPGIIYGVCDPQTGELRYVGQTRRSLDSRAKEHLKHARLRTYDTWLCHWIRSVSCRPKFIILEQGSPDLNAGERHWISWARERGSRLCNHTDGGRGISGWHHTDKAKKAIGDSSRGRVGPWAGKKMSLKHRENLSRSLLGNTQGTIAAHTRWHRNRVIISPSCPHCQEV